MKRSQPLRSDPEKRQAWINSGRKSLPAQSAKRIGDREQREAVRAATLARANHRCEHCGTRDRNLHVHELTTRARKPGSHLDLSETMALCWMCHGRVHDEPAWAESVGLLRHSWDANG